MPVRECDCKEFQDSGHTDECNNHYKKDKPMKIFYCTFSGYYPVGASAIIVAPDINVAMALMIVKLAEMNLCAVLYKVYDQIHDLHSPVISKLKVREGIDEMLSYLGSDSISTNKANKLIKKS